MSDWKRLMMALAVLLVLVVDLTPPAMAQEAVEETPAEEEGETVAEGPQGRFIEEIVVTSRRREENLQEVPVAVSVVSSDQLEDIIATDISDLQATYPTSPSTRAATSRRP